MWQSKLKEIIRIIEDSEVNEIEVTFWGRKYRVVKNRNMDASIKNKNTTVDLSKQDQDVVNNQNVSEKTSEIEMLSPMPGVFYQSSSPDSDAFVKKGDRVTKGQVLCIIEAMKIMNEIESDYDGIISDILVEDAKGVEFNQPLFLITQN